MFRPCDDYILVYPIERKKSDVLHVISDEKYNRGLIVAVGPGKEYEGPDGFYRVPLDVHPGEFMAYVDLDHIYPRYDEDGIEYRILQEADICFMSTREEIDAGHTLTDEKIRDLIERHNMPEKLREAA